MSDYFRTPETRAAQSARAKARWRDPAYRARTTASMQAYWAIKEHRAERSRRMGGTRYLCINWSPERRAEQAEIMRRRWEDPAFREKMRTGCWPQERRARAGEKLHQRWVKIRAALALQADLEQQGQALP